MNQPNLTDGEVRYLFLNRESTKRKALKILSELEACDMKEMNERLIRLGLLKEGELGWRKTKNYGYIPCRENKKWSRDEILEACRLRRKGLRFKEIADTLDRTVGSVQTALWKYREWIQ